mgnify:CR=1 FL=1
MPLRAAEPAPQPAPAPVPAPLEVVSARGVDLNGGGGTSPLLAAWVKQAAATKSR